MPLERISDLTVGTSPIPSESLIEVSVAVGSPPTSYASRQYTIAELFDGVQSPISQGATNPNSGFQGIASISSDYNEIAVYGNYPTDSNYTAISNYAGEGYVYVLNGPLFISPGADVETVIVGNTGPAHPTSLQVLNFRINEGDYELAYAGDWRKTANLATFGTDQAGTGVARDVSFVRGGTEHMRLTPAGVSGSFNGSGVLPASTTPAGWAITSNYEGIGEVNLWSTVDDALAGFEFNQKTGAGTQIVLAWLHGTATNSQWEFYTGSTTFYYGVDTAEVYQGVNTAHPIRFYTSNILRFEVSPDHNAIKMLPVAFASLPAAGDHGRMAAVTDSTTNTWGATITGGGANKVLAFDNGVNWTVFAR